jgi:csr/mutH/archaeal HJR family nuclease
MLKEQGNLLSENIPITKELLEFALANNYKISLKNGDYNQTGFESKRTPNNKDLLSEIHKLYISGEIYVPEVSYAFGLVPDDLMSAFKRAELKTLSFKEVLELWSDKINERRAQTSLERYGVRHPQQSPDIRAKVVATNLMKYGVEVPTQSPEIQAKTKATNLERYGFDRPTKSPKVKAKVKATNLERYGVDSPSRLSRAEKFKQTCLERYGVENPMQLPEIRERAIATNQKRYGGNAPTCSVEVRQKMIETNLERYGAEFPLQSPEIMRKVNETNIERYGVDNPFKSPEIKYKIKATTLERYGVENAGCLSSVTGNGSVPDEVAIARISKRNEYKSKLEANPNDQEIISEAKAFAFENYPFSAYKNLKFFGIHKAKDDPWTEMLVESKIVQPLEVEYIRNHRPEFLRHPVTGKCRELDFLFPDHNLAIEVNGDFTHHDLKEEHEFKYQRCLENGITLIMLTEPEIKDYLVFNKSDILKDIVAFHFDGKDPRETYDIDPSDLFRFGISQSNKFELTPREVGEYIHWYPINID